jgi:hypothetical protein
MRESSVQFVEKREQAFRRATWAVAVLGAAFLTVSIVTADPGRTSPHHFEHGIRPLLKNYCLDCHSTQQQKGELDLERFSSLSEVRRHPKVWQEVIEQLALNEMPPRDKPQPTPAERKQLTDWANAILEALALERAGDPGPVVLRRLSNAEYTYTLRDLTGIESLDPAREFPVDGAAGEGFMNTGNALVMSPSLIVKYLDAAKEIAGHAVLFPDGLRFSPATTRRDWTEEILAEIRGFYDRFTERGGGTAVNLQGIRFDTRDGGVLPLEQNLAATIEAAAAGASHDAIPRLNALAAKRGLSPKYLATLWQTLTSAEPSLLLDPLRARWRAAQPGDAAALANDIAQWQRSLWKFNSVGHIGKAGGPSAWMEPINPLQAKQEIRLKLPASPDANELTIYLSASDAGDGRDGDYVVWEQPRFLAPGRPALLLRDVREVSRELAARRQTAFASAAKCLNAAAEASANPGGTDVAALAHRHGVDPNALAAWLDYLGLGSGGPVKIEGHFTDTIQGGAGYAFINGWGRNETPNLVANSSGQHVRIPGNLKPHSIAVHPSPQLAAVVGWRSPMAGRVRVAAAIQHAHPECGNGVTWALEWRRGSIRKRLAGGVAQGPVEVKPPPIESLSVQPGDLVSLLIGPRDGNHSCDLTAVDLTLTSAGDDGHEWNLAHEVSPDVLAGNPRADRFGNEGVWHFYVEPDKAGPLGPIIPAGSMLAKWQAGATADEKQQLADKVQQLLTSGPPAAKESPDAKLYQQLASLNGPLLEVARNTAASRSKEAAPNNETRNDQRPATVTEDDFGLDPAHFGKHPNGSAVDAASLCLRAPSIIAIRLPADLVAGCEFVTAGSLHPETGAAGSVQLQVLTHRPPDDSKLLPSGQTENGEGPWSSNNRHVSPALPILVNDGSAARRRIESAFDEFRRIFPAALCYTKIVPVDEVVTLTLFYREDHHFARLMLDDAAAAQLDRLWDQLRYVSQDALALVDVFDQLWQYATQDADPKVFEPLREPIKQRAAEFRQHLEETQPIHLEAVLKFAGGAYRRPLTSAEQDELRGLYRQLIEQELPHEDAIRLTLARVLMAPAFLYRLEKAAPSAEPGPVSDWELASRLSYFLWSSLPDAELRAAAAAGTLRDPNVLAAQAHRMLRDFKTRRLATEFACQWLHIHGFNALDEKSERHFPAFADLRDAMYEESIRFFTDWFQRDGSVLDLLVADYTFVNEPLARHYGIPEVSGAEWRRVDGLRKFGRGGILGQAAILAKQSGASRTSPILRGNWVAEALLGDKLPRPPKDVPPLPEEEATETLTIRQLTERHSSDPRCAGCHARIDPFGFALEGFDAIGARRDKDLGGRPIDTRAQVMDGAQIEGLDGLRDYLLTVRREAFVRQFCRKLLGYALGRAVQLSDGPLLAEMRARLEANDDRVGAAVETVVRSRQFREIRGRDAVYED